MVGRVSRREALKAMSAMLPGRGGAQSATIVTPIFGGFYQAAYRKFICDPFEKQTGSKVLLKLGAPSEWLTSGLVNRGHPEIDVLLLPYPFSIRALDEDLGVNLTVKDIPNLANIYPVWYDQYDRKAVGLDYATFGIAYRTDLIPTPPKSWRDLWNPMYAGKLAVPDIISSGIWEFIVTAAKQNGGGEDNLEPAFAAIKALKPNIRKFFKTSLEAGQLLETGEAAICVMAPDSRAYQLIDGGKPVKFIVPEEGAMVGMMSYHVARNSPNKELCFKLIDQALSKDGQEGFCSAIGAGPVVKGAALSGPSANRVPPLDRLLLFNWKKVLPQMADITDRWNREVAR